MRIPVSWLKDYVDIDLSIEALADLLTIAGMEVEFIEYIGIPGGYDNQRLVWSRDKLVLGQVLKVEQHPDADRLVLATVEYGADEPEVVVTGAPNLFPFLGKGDLTSQQITSALALEGAELYDGHKEGLVKTKLKGRALRGIHNRCMLCSEKELGISSDNEGIILFATPPAAPGTPLLDVLGDAVFEINIIPNIARCASIIGVAREVAALTGQPLKMPPLDVPQTGPSIEGKVVLQSKEPALNPRFSAMLIEGVSLAPSPDWMQRRLRLAGQRPINVVVDISNYVMLELGQPNHTFDYDFLRKRADEYDPDGPIQLITRMPQDQETLTTLDGTTHKLLPFNILVTDPQGVLSLGGIMGGAESEIGEHTTNVLLESASWDYMNIRRSASALKIGTDAGFRFSRGVHPSQAILGAKRAARLLHELAGGTVAQGIVDMYPAPLEAPALPLTSEDVRRIGGLDLPIAEIAALLQRLDFAVETHPEHLMVTSPDHRIDIAGTQDLVEEVCRMYGYDRIPTKEMADALPPQRTNVPLQQEMQLQDALVQLGLQEMIAYRLTTPSKEARLHGHTINEAAQEQLPAHPHGGYITLANPISVDKDVMRQSVLASVLECLANNSRFQEHIAFFEWGKGYFAGPPTNDSKIFAMPRERRQLAIAITGPRAGSHWQDDAAPKALDFFDCKGILEALMDECHIQEWHLEAATHPTFRPGRSASVHANQTHIGWIGELHPMVVEAFDMRVTHPVLAIDIDLESMLPMLQDAFKVTPIPAFPAIQEDLALVAEQSLPAATIEAEIRKTGGFLLQSIELFDVYEGQQVPQGKRSLAYHLTFQSPSKTLTAKEVSKQRDRIIKQLESQLGVTLR